MVSLEFQVLHSYKLPFSTPIQKYTDCRHIGKSKDKVGVRHGKSLYIDLTVYI